MISLVNSLSTFATATPIEQERSNSTPFEAMVQGFGLSGQADHIEQAGQTGQDRAIIIVGGAPQDRAIIIVGGKPQPAAHTADLSQDKLNNFRPQTAMSELNRATHLTSSVTDHYKKHQPATTKIMR